jgi:hypothetical protein
VSPTQAVVVLLARNCLLDFHLHVAKLQPQLPLREPLLLRWEGKHIFSVHALIFKTSKRAMETTHIFLRPAATSTVVIELPPLNELKFQRRRSSGMDCGAFGGRVLTRNEPNKLRQDNELAGGAAG